MFKLAVIVLAIILGSIYYFRDANVLTLNPDYKPTVEDRKKIELKQEEEKDPNAPKFQVGQCVALSKDKWEHYKILNFSEDHYIVTTCILYKRCLKETEKILRKDFELKFDEHSLCQCQPQ